MKITKQRWDLIDQIQCYQWEWAANTANRSRRRILIDTLLAGYNALRVKAMREYNTKLVEEWNMKG